MRDLHWLYWNSHDVVVNWSHCYVKVTSSNHVASQRIHEIMGAFFKHENVVFHGEQEKESLSHVRTGEKNPSFRITICHHSAGLVLPNSDPGDRFSYSTFTLMMDPYNCWIKSSFQH